MKNEAFSFEEHIRNSEPARQTAERGIRAVFQVMKDMERSLTVSKCKLEHPLKLLACSFKTSA